MQATEPGVCVNVEHVGKIICAEIIKLLTCYDSLMNIQSYLSMFTLYFTTVLHNDLMHYIFATKKAVYTDHFVLKRVTFALKSQKKDTEMETTRKKLFLHTVQ